jgi:hypothetical protein
MKNNLIYSAVVITALLISGCSGSSSNPSTANNNGVSIDPNVFFKITFNGRTITTNGLISTDINTAIIYNGFSRVSVTSTGTNESFLSLFVQGSILNTYLNNVPNKVDAQITIKKNGTSLGTYDIPNDNRLGAIYDLSTNRTTYLINNDGSVTITSIDQKYVTGTFSLLLEDGSNLIPATGSFRLHKL